MLPSVGRDRGNPGRRSYHQARSRCEAEKPRKPLLPPAGVPTLSSRVPRSSCSCRVHRIPSSHVLWYVQSRARTSPCCCEESAYVPVISRSFLRAFPFRRGGKPKIHLPYSLHEESGSSRTRRRSSWEQLRQQPCRGGLKGLFRDRKRLRDCLETMSVPS